MGAVNRVIRHLRHIEESTLSRLEREIVGERARRGATANSAGHADESHGAERRDNRIPIGPLDV
ncbi:hypothetical protein [Achromobacter deleyi]|uniref:hypothetical protein n=1 Tax=Achromobacter deleyi TaxID=1353891 RepID=UPI001466505C|nr:hypothetical protein [Achromobacter deleyi]CAB3928735.1 hypothetical protein LMG3412_06334 [Achromobacter deleyi]